MWLQAVLGQFPPGQLPPGQLAPGQLAPGQFPPRTFVLPPDNYCLEQSQLQITTFSWLFSVSFLWPNYIISVFCYDNKNRNDNSNKIWSLKLLSVTILKH